MNESYAECLVRRRVPIYSYVVNILMGAVTAYCILLAFTTNVIGVILMFLSGFGAYILYRNSRVEFEYLYVDKTLCIDKILGKAKRKKAWEGKIEDIQIIAPSDSHVLGDYQSAGAKVMDFSSQLSDAKTYTVIVQAGSESLKIIFEPNEKMLNCIAQTAPRKVVKYKK